MTPASRFQELAIFELVPPFVVPEDVIGDEQGYVSIVVSLSEDYEAGAVTLEKAKVGKMKEVPPLIKGEVLWSTNDNLQLWLLLSYIAAAGGAWLELGMTNCWPVTMWLALERPLACTDERE